MSGDRVGALEALLGEAESAHATYESTELGGVYDTEWPRWYAEYAVSHGIGALLGRDVKDGEVAEALTMAWTEYEASQPAPDEPWTPFIARRLAASGEDGEVPR